VAFPSPPRLPWPEEWEEWERCELCERCARRTASSRVGAMSKSGSALSSSSRARAASASALWRNKLVGAAALIADRITVPRGRRTERVDAIGIVQ
jgi:hypothetical protein